MQPKDPERPNSSPGGGITQPPSQSVVGVDAALERFAKSFEASARRWELIVYPALFAFIVLAIYGFYLVFSMTQDMRNLVNQVDPNMGEHMEAMTMDISTLAVNIESMTNEVQRLTRTVGTMNTTMIAMRDDTAAMSRKMDTLEPILANMVGMNQSMQWMTRNTQVMTWDINNMTRPASFMNAFFPW